MPRAELVFYQDRPGQAPVLDWLNELRQRDPRAYANCLAVIERLAEFGHELRRPAADLLRNGIHELRVKRGHVSYRILYFFHGRNLAILAHAVTKEDRVSSMDIERALRRKSLFESDPEAHSYSENVPHAED